ncbi:hypothetical protein LRS10_01200 [Phenylobacterium sp. J426]|uniref:hypothetical protein n=1 Tax=Phenylobacterium sp. J426 TaxID=2898439 RepID=UPI00215081EA|nr:hypothetical protein [Phenylobacterium sp. J426]MCR5872934.1 hypothetical protein [Phenylobacterium sp. J426]
MLKKVLWIALACAVLLAALAISRSVNLTSNAPKEPAPVQAPAAEDAAEPTAAAEPAPQPTAPIVKTPEELQVEEDAAAVGLTTVEPEPEAPAQTPPN